MFLGVWLKWGIQPTSYLVALRICLGSCSLCFKPASCGNADRGHDRMLSNAAASINYISSIPHRFMPLILTGSGVTVQFLQPDLNPAAVFQHQQRPPALLRAMSRLSFKSGPAKQAASCPTSQRFGLMQLLLLSTSFRRVGLLLVVLQEPAASLPFDLRPLAQRLLRSNMRSESSSTR